MQLRETIENKLAHVEGSVRPELDAMKEKLVAVNESVIDFVKANPAKCLFGAIALGFLAGRLARGFSHGKA